MSTYKGEPSEAAASFAWWDHKYLPLLRELDRTAPILELGCGSGRLLEYLGRRGFLHALGIDMSAEQCALAAQRGLKVEVADAFDFLEDHSSGFQAIVAVDVLEHFTRDELLRLIPRIFTALRPHGLLLVQTANGAGLFARQVIFGDLTHVTIFTPQSLAQLLRPFGFEDLAFYETGPIPIRIRGKFDTLAWRAITGIASLVRSIETGKRQSIWTENFICLARRPG